MKKLFRYFFQGLLFVAPAGITIFVVYLVFNYIDGPIRNFIRDYFGVQIPGVGLLVIFTVITFLGWIGPSIIFKPFRVAFDRFMTRTPIIKLLYTSITDFLSAFVGEKRKFNRPVLVKVNLISNLEKMGFITTDDLSYLGIKDKVVVLFPHSYNWSGEMFIVPVEHITPLNIPPAEVMKFVVTGGVTRV
jgi:uncharacterized membrane protein